MFQAPVVCPGSASCRTDTITVPLPKNYNNEVRDYCKTHDCYGDFGGGDQNRIRINGGGTPQYEYTITVNPSKEFDGGVVITIKVKAQ